MNIREFDDGIIKINLTIDLIKYVFSLLLFLFGLLPVINSLHDNGFFAIPGLIFILLSIMILTSKNNLIIDPKSRQLTHEIWAIFGLINKNEVINFDEIGQRGFYVHLTEIRRRGKNLISCHLLLHTHTKVRDLFSCPEMLKSKLKNIVEKANKSLISSGIYIESVDNYYQSPIGH